MNSSERQGHFLPLAAGSGAVLLAIFLMVATTRPAFAGCQCGIPGPHHHFFHHNQGPPPVPVVTSDIGGSWYWMRSPEQERRVVMGLYNRYCIRCHGVDGRGVWDI